MMASPSSAQHGGLDNEKDQKRECFLEVVALAQGILLGQAAASTRFGNKQCLLPQLKYQSHENPLHLNSPCGFLLLL